MAFPLIMPLYPRFTTESAFSTPNTLNILEFVSPAVFSKFVPVGPGQRAVTDTPYPYNSSYIA